MNASAGMLLLAKEALAKEVSARLGQDERYISVTCQDPYDALLQSSLQPLSAIVVEAPQADFSELCRALKRLQNHAKLFVLSPPSAEPDVRPLVGDLLEDYFITPPRRQDMQQILRSMSSESGDVGRAVSNGPTALTARQVAEMLEAVRNVTGLEAHIAEIVTRHCGTTVMWMDAYQAPSDLRPLLLAAGDTPRVLVPKTPLGEFDSATREYLTAIQDCLPALLATARRTEALHRLAITDHLTGAYNRRYFYHVTDRILAQNQSASGRVTLLLFDIDDFKHYNDTYGHAAGDEILREVTKLIRRTTRVQDVVARIGGDEFAVLFWDVAELRLPDSQPPQTAQIMVERFCKAVARHGFPSLGPEAQGSLTISGGLAGFPKDGQNCRELLRSADVAMKSVKRTGKNAIRLIGA